MKNKNKRLIQVYCTLEEAQLFKDLSQKNHLSISSFIKYSVLKEAQPQ